MARIVHILIALTLLATAAALPAPARVGAQDLTSTPTASPRPDERADACEPNNAAGQACALPMDAVSGPFTFVPEGDQDYFGLFLGDSLTGLQTTVTVRATAGLDLYATIARADTGATVGTIASPAISTTLAADLTGWMVLRVENRAPGLASGQSYRVEIRRTLPPPPATPSPAGLERPDTEPDSLENNYDPQTAAPIGVGVVYDLSFVCPVAGGCPGGDHDYLRFDAKAGVHYLLSTFDLAPGVDTVLDLLGYDAERGWLPLATNDDERPGAAFLSTLRWQAATDGPVLVRVGPRDGGLQPILTGDEPLPTYRFAVALAESDLGSQLEERIAAQTNAPAPTSTPAAVSEPVAPASEGSGETGRSGIATPEAPVAPTSALVVDGVTSGPVVITDDAPAYTAPSLQSEVLATLPAGSAAVLTGKVSGVWAEITAPELVGGGWVDRRRLRATSSDEAAEAPSGAGAPGTSATPMAAMSEAGPNTNSAGRTVVVRSLPSPLQPTPAVAPVPVTALATVTVAKGQKPIAGLRVQLVDIFDTMLVELLTGADGTVTLNAPVAPGQAIYVLIPALGVRERLSPDNPSISIRIPEERP